MLDIDYNSIMRQLHDRKERLGRVIRDVDKSPHLLQLLHEVDSALERIDNGSFGICEVCREPIETERLVVDPLIRVCLDHLSEHQQRVLEQDLDMASKIQQALLPSNNFVSNEWEIYFHYEPAGMVSGDYCDIIKQDDKSDDNLIVTVGDVSGKGVAASMLMTHMHALFHSMTDFELSVNQLMQKANRLFCESTVFTHYATLAVAKLHPNGKIEICNAGHCSPLVLGRENLFSIEATGMPIGIFSEGEYSAKEIQLRPGEILLLYTDGLNEARKDEEEFGVDRLKDLAGQLVNKSAKDVVEILVQALKEFLSGTVKLDDLTILAVKRKG